MGISEYSLRNRTIVIFLLAVMLCGGVYGFRQMGKKEDSLFVIKSAVLSCSYPGASPEVVEELITEPIEREVQSLSRVKDITSTSQYGLSTIKVELDPATPPKQIPQLWDELRRKVLNISQQLPEGASAISVNDDFGDLYGIYCALVGDQGITPTELRDAAQELKLRLQSIEGVDKVAIYGEQQPVVNVEISLSALAAFSIRPEQIAQTIATQNTLISSGEEQLAEFNIKVLDSGEYGSIEEISNQLLMATDGKQFRLGDIANIYRSYIEPSRAVMSVDGNEAIGIAVATSVDSDVVKVGRRVKEVMQDFVEQMPIGITIEELYPEDKIAREATNSFILNLIESLAIVVVVIMAVMGFREGILIGSSLLFTISGSMLLMNMVGEGLNRTSLAGFIIAMGMLVDNAIVVTDGARQRQISGMPLKGSLVESATQTKWSLLGATLIAIFSFLPLYLAPSSVAEIVKPLFVVITISLMMSWILALSQTPLMGLWLLGEAKTGSSSHKLSEFFTRLLVRSLKMRWGVVFASALLFALSIWGMSRLPQNFFPNLDKPYFRADVILPEGYDISTTQSHLKRMEQWLMARPEVKRVSYTAGGTPPRYYLASSSESGVPNFGNILVELHSSRQSGAIEELFNSYVTDSMPDVWLRSSLFKLSPVPDAAIEFGFLGNNLDTLFSVANRAVQIMQQTSGADNIRLSPGNRVPTIEPLYSQMKGQRIGISRRDLSQGLELLLDGYHLADMREKDQLLPIVLVEQNSDNNPLRLATAPVFSPSGKVYSVEQAIDEFRFGFKLQSIERFNRCRVVKAQCDPARGVNTQELFTSLHSKIEQMELPEGCSLKIFGEEKSQQESNSALADKLPLTAILILTTLLVLLSDLRNVIAVVAIMPMIFAGVVLALAISGKVFNFFALLGLLGLVGMNIKSAIVLIDRIELLQREGKTPYESLIEAAKSRTIPVIVASATTILGMLPLLFDSLFGAMAATIMGGLFVATLLTIILLPTIYSILYKIKIPSQNEI